MRLCGGCEIHFPEENNIAYLRWIFTNEEIRGKGIGSSSMDALKAEVLERGIVQLDTDTAVGNLAAQHFYEKNHFIKRGLTIMNTLLEIKNVMKYFGSGDAVSNALNWRRAVI